MYVSQTLGRFGAGFHRAAVTPEVMHHAKRAVVDWYAALIAGYGMNPTPLLEKAMAEDLDRGAARLALIQGTASHAAEVDDIFRHAIYHPGAPTISAALAVAQQQGASGEQLLRAVIAGYEVSTRIGQVLGRAHYQHWHNTGTVGTFGAAEPGVAAAAEARLSIPYVVATALLFGSVRLAACEAARLADVTLRAPMARVVLDSRPLWALESAEDVAFL